MGNTYKGSGRKIKTKRCNRSGSFSLGIDGTFQALHPKGLCTVDHTSLWPRDSPNHLFCAETVLRWGNTTVQIPGFMVVVLRGESNSVKGRAVMSQWQRNSPWVHSADPFHYLSWGNSRGRFRKSQAMTFALSVPGEVLAGLLAPAWSYTLYFADRLEWAPFSCQDTPLLCYSISMRHCAP